ncbi:MAG: hypothetical protein ABWY11_05835 [Umezawaea sp.]
MTPPEVPQNGPIVVQGATCAIEGALAVNRRLRPMRCVPDGQGELRWAQL